VTLSPAFERAIMVGRVIQQNTAKAASGTARLIFLQSIGAADLYHPACVLSLEAEFDRGNGA